MVMMMIMMTMTMMIRRNRIGYLRTVIFESVYNPPPVTVQQYFCTPSHSEQSVQAVTQRAKSAVQKYG